MSSIRKCRRGRMLCYVLVGAMLLPLLPCVAPAAQAQERGRTILLFPVTDETSSDLPELRKLATDAVQMAVDAVEGLECSEFSRTSPLVRRAVLEGRVLPTQVEAGPTGPRDAVSIGYQLGVDTVLLTSVQSYLSTTEPRSVEVILSGQAYDVKENYDAEAGEARREESIAPVHAFGVVGTSRRIPGYEGSDRLLAREALSDAAYRVAKVLNGASISEVSQPKPEPRRESRTTKWLAVAAVVGLLVWAVSSMGKNDDTGPSVDALPPTPEPLQVVGSNTIVIRWDPPTGTSLELARYELQRSVNGGSWAAFGSGGESKNIPANQVRYSDYDVSSDNSYRYRIRSIYTNSTYSVWVEFAGVTIE